MTSATVTSSILLVLRDNCQHARKFWHDGEDDYNYDDDDDDDGGDVDGGGEDGGDDHCDYNSIGSGIM